MLEMLVSTWINYSGLVIIIPSWPLINLIFISFAYCTLVFLPKILLLFLDFHTENFSYFLSPLDVLRLFLRDQPIQANDPRHVLCLFLFCDFEFSMIFKVFKSFI